MEVHCSCLCKDVQGKEQLHNYSCLSGKKRAKREHVGIIMSNREINALSKGLVK